jgi:hypothetical protein
MATKLTCLDQCWPGRRRLLGTHSWGIARKLSLQPLPEGPDRLIPRVQPCCDQSVARKTSRLIPQFDFAYKIPLHAASTGVMLSWLSQMRGKSLLPELFLCGTGMMKNGPIARPLPRYYFVCPASHADYYLFHSMSSNGLACSQVSWGLL